MAYVDGFVVAVPKASKELYRQHAATVADLFRQWGATRVVETWGDDVPEGKTTDFFRAVAAKPDEVVVFSWVEYPDKETRAAVQKKMMTEMPRMPEMPFDGKRLIYGGFEMLLDR